jgi:hypothetical protein
MFVVLWLLCEYPRFYNTLPASGHLPDPLPPKCFLLYLPDHPFLVKSNKFTMARELDNYFSI